MCLAAAAAPRQAARLTAGLTARAAVCLAAAAAPPPAARSSAGTAAQAAASLAALAALHLTARTQGAWTCQPVPTHPIQAAIAQENSHMVYQMLVMLVNHVHPITLTGPFEEPCSH